MDILYNNTLINSIVDKLFKHRRVGTPKLIQMTSFKDLTSNMRSQKSSMPIMNKYTPLSSPKDRPSLNTASFICMAMDQIGWNALMSSGTCLRTMPSAALIFQGAARVKGIWWRTAWKRRKTFVNLNISRDFILNFLKGRGFKRFILWGRSMGATSALLYSIKYKPSNIILLVLDSPFHSF